MPRSTQAFIAHSICDQPMQLPYEAFSPVHDRWIEPYARTPVARLDELKTRLET